MSEQRPQPEQAELGEREQVVLRTARLILGGARYNDVGQLIWTERQRANEALTGDPLVSPSPEGAYQELRNLGGAERKELDSWLETEVGATNLTAGKLSGMHESRI